MVYESGFWSFVGFFLVSCKSAAQNYEISISVENTQRQV